MSEKKPRLRWKRNPRETGLRAVGAGPRGWTLHDGQEEFACVNALGGDWSRPFSGWYWVAYSRPGIALRNTCDSPIHDPEEAKAEAMAYVKAGLATNA
jgi:hypothetical protein